MGNTVKGTVYDLKDFIKSRTPVFLMRQENMEAADDQEETGVLDLGANRKYRYDRKYTYSVVIQYDRHHDSKYYVRLDVDPEYCKISDLLYKNGLR